MTSQQSNTANSGNRAFPFTDVPDATMDTEHSSLETTHARLGSRLRAAREARGLDVETCAHALRLPAKVLRQIEGNEYEGIDYQVYLGGYLTKYARYLGVDESEVKGELERIKPSQPTLVATGGMSHSRYLLEHYARAATYVVLTAAIVVPTIWLGVRGTLDRDVSHLAPLDAAPVAQVDAPVSASSTAPAATPAAEAKLADATGSAGSATPASQPPATTPVAQPQEQQPLMASMAPFPSLGGDTARSAPQPTSADAAVGNGAHSLVLSLQGASWVEVTAKDGSRLEYGLLPAGSSKTYHSDQPLEVRIGNANGAQVMLDGQPMALDSYRRSNVAHFRVEVRDGKASPAGA
ncbi:helix-turn-helix domain-containing protein [Dyella jiangningensis]|uniref:Helix-turn-helix domain-containing protein n=1 Tax=Dyella jiangningensis TaxID=1379159 RepID=A0A328P5K4_9GAMM|nr:helix-turn-helix domain-containing protein [Dyella jiangningensis]